MEAVRERPHEATSRQVELNDSTLEPVHLPPAPQPFPTDQLAQHRSSCQASATTIDNLADVQGSLVHALHSLLPDDSAQDVAPRDLRLARVLTDLLEATYELDSIHPSPSTSSPNSSTLPHDETLEHLNHTLSLFYLSTVSRPPPSFDASHDRQNLHPAIHFVQEELVWGCVESLSHAALELIRSRDSPEPSSSPEREEVRTPAFDPPKYSDVLPEYDAGSQDGADEKPESSTPSAHHGDEKIQRDLDDVYDAIDRLYAVAPRLQDQCVELKASSSKEGKRQMELRREQEKKQELEKIWDLIERTHKGRRTDRQRADVWADAEEDMKDSNIRKHERFYEDVTHSTRRGRLAGQDSINRSVKRDIARANHLRQRGEHVKRVLDADVEDDEARRKRQAFIADIISRTKASRMADQDYHMSVEERIQAKRESFIENLVDYSSSGRLADQDSLPPTPRTAPDKIDDSAEMVSVGDFLRSSPGPKGLRRNRSRSVPLDDVPNDMPPPTLRKRIAGLVRRSSATFNLQIKKDTDMSVSYIAEHQENLDAVQVMVHGVGIRLKHQYTLRTESQQSNIAHLISAIDNLDIPINLPCHVVADQSVTMASSTLHLEARLAALPTSADCQASNLQHPLSASDLRAAKPSAFCCISCDRRLADLRNVLEEEAQASGSGFKNLPSEHWSEMMEVWMCHPDPSFTARVAAKSKSGFWPTQAQVLVGNSYLLVHADNLSMYNCMTGQVDKAIVISIDDPMFEPVCRARGGREALAGFVCPGRETSGKGSAPGRYTCPISTQRILVIPSGIKSCLAELSRRTTTLSTTSTPEALLTCSQVTSWAPLTCLCGETLGKQYEALGQVGHGTVKLNKWAVGLVTEGGDAPRFSLSTYVVSDMLELAQAHATHRFHIVDAESGEKHLSMWMFNPSVRISYRKASTVTPTPSPLPMAQRESRTYQRLVDDVVPAKEDAREMRAAKIVYQLVDGSRSKDSAQFGASAQVEDLKYPREVCDCLAQALTDSTACYPLARRTMGSCNVGFLQRV